MIVRLQESPESALIEKTLTIGDPVSAGDAGLRYYAQVSGNPELYLISKASFKKISPRAEVLEKGEAPKKLEVPGPEK